MSSTALTLILLAAALHAGWNLLVKGARRKETFTWWALLCGSILFLPVLVLSGPVPWRIWPYAVASALVEVLYYLALARAYDLGDFSFVYPIARGAAPALLSIWAVLFLGERPTPGGLAGLTTIILGLALVGGALRPRAATTPGAGGPTDRSRTVRAGAIALSVALCISVYSVIDAAAVRFTAPAGYTVLVLGLTCLFLAPVVIARHGVAALAAEWRGRPFAIVAVGVMTLLAYLLVLEAYARAPVSYAGALRESSILMAALAGRIVLGETLGPARVAGAGLTFAGILLVAWGG